MEIFGYISSHTKYQKKKKKLVKTNLFDTGLEPSGSQTSTSFLSSRKSNSSEELEPSSYLNHE